MRQDENLILLCCKDGEKMNRLTSKSVGKREKGKHQMKVTLLSYVRVC